MGFEEFFGGVAWGAGGADGVDGCGGAWGGGFGEEGEEVAEVLLELAEVGEVRAGDGGVEGEEHGLFLLELGFEDLARAGDGVSLVVEEGLDAEGVFDVAAAVEALTGAALVGFELGEFRLPEAQDVGGDVTEAGDFSDAEVELVGDDVATTIATGRSGRLGAFADWLVLGHAMLRAVVVRLIDKYRPEV